MVQAPSTWKVVLPQHTIDHLGMQAIRVGRGPEHLLSPHDGEPISQLAGAVAQSIEVSMTGLTIPISCLPRQF